MRSSGAVSTRGWLIAAAYIAVVCFLAASAFSGPDEGFSWREGAAMCLTLPALVVALPVIYVLGALLWTVTDAGDGGPMWPVTVGFTVMFAVTALINVWVLRRAVGWYNGPSWHSQHVSVPPSTPQR
jgi:hypothetical protein